MIGALATAAPALAQAPANASNDAAAEVAAAIDGLRGIDARGLQSEALRELGARLDQSIQVLFEHPDETRAAVRRVLASEKKDSFLVIDLARVLVELEESSPEVLIEVSEPLERVDPTADPDGFFILATRMAGVDCRRCIGAIARILQFDAMRLSAGQERLPVDLNMALSLTLGRFGNAALPTLRRALADPACSPRANAAYLYGMLLPDEHPSRLRSMALNDDCPRARTNAWTALGMLDPDDLPILAERRLSAEPEPPAFESSIIARALSLSSAPEAAAILESLAGHPDPTISTTARTALKTHQETKFDRAALARLAGTADRERRRAFHQQLTVAIATGEVQLRNTFEELVAMLSQRDISLLNRVRAGILAKPSQAAMESYMRLTTLTRALRSTRSVASEPAAGRPDR